MSRRRILIWGFMGTLLTLLSTDALSQATDPLPPTGEQERDRQQVLELQREGNELLGREKRLRPPEKQRTHRERRQIFDKAAWRLQQYIRKWTQDKSSVEYLHAIFRLGTFYEYAEWYDMARLWYRMCNQHTRIGDPRVLWENKPLSGELMDRLRKIEKQLGVDRGIHIPGVVIKSEKDGIALDISEFTPDDSHRPLLDNEAATVALRRTPFAHREGAVSIGKALLDKNNLQYHVSEATGLVVFGVGADAEQVNFLTNQIVRMQQGLTTEYFDRATIWPVLFVYANLQAGDEYLGCEISRAIHFRKRTHIEGYYEPLDHSLVLRKSLYFRDSDQKWFLGTAFHELVHAHIHVEFPHAPLWLDEGLSSLHEASDWTGPIDNYRLYYVQEADRTGKLPRLEALLNPVAADWGGKKARLMHAMARYFCFYLYKRSSPQNNLKDVYHLLRDNYLNGEGDLSSEGTLRKVTGMELDELEKHFVRFIRSLDKTLGDGTLLKNKIHRYIHEL